MSDSESDGAEYELSSLCNQLLAMMMDHELEEGGEGRMCCTSLYLPAQRSDPQYYDKVKKIVDFTKIQEKVKKQEYDGFKTFIDDFRTLFSNIYLVYTQDSIQYNDAKELEQMFADQLKIMISLDYFDPEPSSPSSVASFLDEEAASPPSPNRNPAKAQSPVRSPFKTKMRPNISPEANLATAKKEKPRKLRKTPKSKVKSKSVDLDSEPEFVTKTPKIKLKVPKTKSFNHDSEFDFEPNKERFINTLHGLLQAARTSPAVVQTFQDLPDKEEYPEYYEVIPIPVSMSLISERVEMGRYQSVYHCVSDIMMMCANAFTFNEAKSKIYKQAQAVKQGVLTYLAMMKREELFTRQPQIPRRSDYDSEGEVEGEEVGSNMIAPYMWRIYNEILTYTNHKGRILCTAFLLLPENDEIPLYYEEIKRPMSLSRIKSKIVRRRYESLSDMAEDLELMFKNAMKFNKEISIIYKDSILLRDITVKFTEEVEIQMQDDITKFKSQGRSDHLTSEKKVIEETPKQRGRKKGNSSIIKSQAQISKSLKSPLRSPERKIKSPERSKTKGEKSAALNLVSQSIAKSTKKKTEASPLVLGRKRHHSSTSSATKEDAGESNELVEESLVEECLLLMENSGPGLVGELYSTCTHLFRKADNLQEVEEHLMSQQKPATSLLLIVTGMMARMDPMCVEHLTVAEIQSKVVKFIKEHGGNTALLKGVPVYNYKEDKYVVQEELLSVFRYTKNKTFLLNPKIKRNVERSCDIDSEPKLNILSEDAVMIKLSLIKDALAAKENESSSSEGPGPKKVLDPPERKLSIDKKKILKTPSTIVKKSLLREKTPGSLKKSLKQKLKEKSSTPRFTPKKIKTDLSQFDPDLSDEDSEPAHVTKLHPAKAPKTTPMAKVQRFREAGTPVRMPEKAMPKTGPTVQCEDKDKYLELIMSLKELRDSSGRITHTVFLTLPTAEEFPAYYTRIKYPMAISIIDNRICMGWFHSLDAVVSACILMVRNALNFNEEDAKIYEDALDLQCELIKKRRELLPLCVKSSVVPETLIRLQERFQAILDGLHSDLSLVTVIKDLDPKEQQGNSKIFYTNISLSEIRHNVACGYYLRLDHFQDHMLQLLSHALRAHVKGEEHVKVLQLYKLFLMLRDEGCKDVIESSAFAESLEDFNENYGDVLNREDTEFQPAEQDIIKKEEEDCNETIIEEEEDCPKEEDRNYCKTIEYNDQTYQIGDYIEITQGKNTDKRHIICIEKMWRNNTGDPWVKGHLFLRPEETFHLPSRPFYNNEVFKSDYNQPFQLNRVHSKCLVMCLKDYKTNQPQDPQITVYICDCRYQVTSKMFSKIKIWRTVAANTTPLKPRESPTSLGKSVLEKYRREKEEKMEIDKEENKEDVKTPTISRYCDDNVEDPSLHDMGDTYYIQYNLDGVGTFKLGDFVYLRSDSPLPYIARIDKIHEDDSGTAWINGPWFIRPSDTKGMGSRLFYNHEVFLSSIVDTNPMQSIEGWCYVLTFKDYISKRPTEALEKDVYMCESRYDESAHKYTRVTRLYHHAKCGPFNLKPTEWYNFPKPLTLQKVSTPYFEIPLKPPAKSSTRRSFLKQTSEMGSPLLKAHNEKVHNTILGGTAVRECSPIPRRDFETRPHSGTESPAISPQSGYTMYVSTQRAKGSNLSNKMLFLQWRKLDRSTQITYQKLFDKQRKAAIEGREADSYQNTPPLTNSPQERGPIQHPSGHASPSYVKQIDTRPLVYCCRWKDCTAMFECGQEYHFHVIDTRTHLHKANDEWRCYWKGCNSATATEQGLESQILLRRHLLAHVNEGATRVNKLSEQYFPKQRTNPQPVMPRPTPGITHCEPVIHSQVYRNYLKKLDQHNVEGACGAVVSMKYSNWFGDARIAQPTLIDALTELQQSILRSCTKLSQWS